MKEKEQIDQGMESSQKPDLKPDLKAIIGELAESELEEVSGGQAAGTEGPTFNVVYGCGC